MRRPRRLPGGYRVLAFAVHFLALLFGSLWLSTDAWLWLAALFIVVTIPCALRGIWLIARRLGINLEVPTYYGAYYYFRIRPRRFP